MNYRGQLVGLIGAAVLAFSTAASPRDLNLSAKETATVDGEAPYVQLAGRAKLTLAKGATVAHLHAKGDSEVIVEEGAKVSHLIASERSSVRVLGGQISNLSVLGNAQAHLHYLRLANGGLYSSTFSGQGIVYEPQARLHFYADVISTDTGFVRGRWRNGERFEIGLVEKRAGVDIFGRPSSTPSQLVVHELPGPAFDCRQAVTGVEKEICADPGLAKLDRQLAKLYGEALAAPANAAMLRQAQLRWLSERNKCSSRACIEDAYRRRIAALHSSGEMTNSRAQAICQTVVRAVNDGSIERRFVKFGATREEDQRRWTQSQPGNSLQPSQATSIQHRGKTRRFGILTGGGTCGNCDIADLDAKEIELFPPDDEQERLRWASWGNCDYLLMVEGEPVVVTGFFGHGASRARLVAWVAPDGGKRAICYLGRSGSISTKAVRSADTRLCRAVVKGDIDSVPWEQSFVVEEEENASQADGRQRWDQYQTAELDLDMDGSKDFIVRYEHSSGAGCGSFHQWLAHAVKKEGAVAADSANLKESTNLEESANLEESTNLEESADSAKSAHAYRVEHSPSTLNGFLTGIAGPIEGSDKGDGLFSLKMFSFRGKPYLLARGETTSASVFSLWGREARTWCEFDLLPQHTVERYYPIETWPAPGTNR